MHKRRKMGISAMHVPNTYVMQMVVFATSIFFNWASIDAFLVFSHEVTSESFFWALSQHLSNVRNDVGIKTIKYEVST